MKTADLAKNFDEIVVTNLHENYYYSAVPVE